MILELNRTNSTPLYAQIVVQVREQISRGVLKIGDRLPANRELAKALGVNRSTITTAYDELTADGLITSYVGRGTFVSAVPVVRPLTAERERATPSPLPWSALLADQRRDEWLGGMQTWAAHKEAISFAYALPAPELFPLEEFRRSVDRVLRKEGRALLQLGTSNGYEPLQQYLAGQMARAGITVQPGEVLITNGCQQSLDLLRQILVRPGEEVVLENPTYPGAISTFCGQHAKFVSVPVNHNGMDLDVLEDVLAQRRPKLIYTVPTFQNPTGAALDGAARRRLLELAAHYRVPIIEDDIYGELRYDGAALPTLKALDKYGLVIYLNSFSKVGFPGLRIGWITAPRIVIEHLHAVKQRTDLHANLLGQAAINDFARQGLLAKHIQRCKKHYAQRRDAMLTALERHFPREIGWTAPQGGMALWVQLPESLNASQLVLQAAEQGVSFSPGERFYASAAQNHTLRLAFTMANPATIDEGVKRLGAVLKTRLAGWRKQREFSRAAVGKALV